MSEAETPETVLNRISGVLGVDTVFYIEGKKVYLGVHTSAKRIESQMEAIVVFTNQFPDYVLYVMGDFNVLLSPSGTTALQIHSKSLSESEVNANNVQAIIDFHRPLTFIQPPVDTTCKRRWETTQGEKVGVSFSVKIDYIFRVNLAGETAKVTEPTEAHLFEHDVELTVSRPPAPWYPADHFTLEVQLGDEIFRSWNICGESQTADASSTAAPAASRPASAAASARASQKVVQSNEPVLAIAPNCFEFLTANANAFYNDHLTEINEHFNRVMDAMPDYDGVRFRHRYLGASSLPEDTAEEEKKKIKAGEISSVLRNCPSVNIHYKAFLLEEPEKVNDLTSPLPPLPADQHDKSILAMEVASPEDNAAPVEAVVVEGTMTPLGEDFATPSGKLLSDSTTTEAVAVTEVISSSSAPAEASNATDDLPKSPRAPVDETAVSSSAATNTVLTDKAKVQMRLLKGLFETADAQFRAGATPLQLALYEQYMEFRCRLEEIPVIRTLLTLFFNEVTAFDRQDFLYVLLPALKTRRVKVWALQEVSAPLQAKLDKLSRVLQQEYGYEMVRREIPADQKTWGVLLVRQDLQL